jgi:hypothetical protein
MQKQTNVRAASQKSVRLRGKRSPAPAAPQKLKLLVTIVGRNKAEFYMDLLQSMEINIQLSMLGHGTANTQMLHLLGLSDSDKAVIFSIVREDRAKETLALLEQKFRTVRGGKGIAYTIPLKSVVGVAIYRFLCDNRMPMKEEL